ncbi:hypothetical protein PWT90_09073 [Aphanocladium album]|nr:hypothetical protein PWT90_09073 [Aphanocladium album]
MAAAQTPHGGVPVAPGPSPRGQDTESQGLNRRAGLDDGEARVPRRRHERKRVVVEVLVELVGEYDKGVHGMLAKLAGVVPPTAKDLAPLSSRRRARDAAELNAVWNAQRFSWAGIEENDEGGPGEAVRMGEWRRGVRKTTYPTLIAGAVLGGAYQGPLRVLYEDENDENVKRFDDGSVLPWRPDEFAPRFTIIVMVTTVRRGGLENTGVRAVARNRG